MSRPAWEGVVELPDDLDDETVEQPRTDATGVQDMTDEVCPYPRVEARKAATGLDQGNQLIQETDHVPSTENVQRAVGDDADATVWRSGDGVCPIFLHRG